LTACASPFAKKFKKVRRVWVTGVDLPGKDGAGEGCDALGQQQGLASKARQGKADTGYASWAKAGGTELHREGCGVQGRHGLLVGFGVPPLHSRCSPQDEVLSRPQLARQCQLAPPDGPSGLFSGVCGVAAFAYW